MIKMEKIISILASIIAIINGIISIYKSISQQQIIITPWFVLSVILFLIWISFLALYSDKRRWTFIYKYISHYFGSPNRSFYLDRKEIIYTYLPNNECRYERKVQLVSNFYGLNEYTGWFRWSGPRPSNGFHVQCTSSCCHAITVGQDLSWNFYKVSFDDAPKGEKRNIDVVICDLKDPFGEAFPFCSADITERTDTLIFNVVLANGSKFNLEKVRFSTYDTCAGAFSIIEDKYSREGNVITYYPEEERICVEIKFPIYGYRYQLSWGTDEKKVVPLHEGEIIMEDKG